MKAKPLILSQKMKMDLRYVIIFGLKEKQYLKSYRITNIKIHKEIKIKRQKQ